MVAIPAGYGFIGGEGTENTPRHEVAMARFFMDTHEVTVGAYATCVEKGTCKPMRKDNPFCNIHFTGRDKHAVNCVDWNDADAYCKMVGKRLPREVEWEYAARGGAEHRLYSWGNDEPTRQNGCYMHEGGTCEVGQFAPGAFGLFDMTGNVWEWTSSWFAPYPGEAAKGQFKVYRGGSWSRRFAKWMRNDLRNRYKVDEHSGAVGFRCAQDAVPTTCPAGAVVEGPSCVRRGAPTLCEPGFALVDGACKPIVGPSGGPIPSGMAVVPSAAPSVDPATETPVRVRSPGFDKDCEAHYPGLPNAYQWRGGTFQAREPLISGAGCKKRDIGVGWSSACCP